MNSLPLNGKKTTLVIIGAIASLTLGLGECGSAPGTPQDVNSTKKVSKKIKKYMKKT